MKLNKITNIILCVVILILIPLEYYVWLAEPFKNIVINTNVFMSLGFLSFFGIALWYIIVKKD